MSRWWSDSPVEFIQHAPNLDAMLASCDAALVIGDPALFALEDAASRERRTGEKLLYLDLAEEWVALLGVPWVSAVWAIREASIARSGRTLDSIAADLATSRDHGVANIEALVKEWSVKLPIPTETIQAYLTSNIFYVLDDECLNGMHHFYNFAAKYGILPKFSFQLRAISR
jgi:chorismate dehydratase